MRMECESRVLITYKTSAGLGNVRVAQEARGLSHV